jgi:MtN3 and saliva related transmembrane protein
MRRPHDLYGDLKPQDQKYSMMTNGIANLPWLTWMGLLAAFCSTAAFLPQVVKTWRTRSTKDISIVMFMVLVIGILLWLAYGIMIQDIPLIVANSVTLLFAGTILFFKLKHG